MMRVATRHDVPAPAPNPTRTLEAFVGASITTGSVLDWVRPRLSIQSTAPLPEWVQSSALPACEEGHGNAPTLEFLVAPDGYPVPVPRHLDASRRIVFADDRLGTNDLPMARIALRADEQDLDLVSETFARPAGVTGGDFICYDYGDLFAVAGAGTYEHPRIGRAGFAVVLDGAALGAGRLADQTRKTVSDLRARGYGAGLYVHALLHGVGDRYTLAMTDAFLEAALADHAGACVFSSGFHHSRNAVVVVAFARERYATLPFPSGVMLDRLQGPIWWWSLPQEPEDSLSTMAGSP